MPVKNLTFPGSKTPEMIVNSIKLTEWKLSISDPENFDLIIIYRGLHCPICSKYLQEFDKNFDEFLKLGTNLIAISTDTEERAIKSFKDWKLEKLNLGYNLDQKTAIEWGLYLSKGIPNPSLTIAEPEFFVEPGIFLVDADKRLYFSNIQSMPFTRPPVRELLSGVKFAIDKKYPARGTLKYLK
jgi:Peroxiredoxin